MLSAIIVSKDFEGKPLLKRHRMVNNILEDVLHNVHAFEMKTWTEEQWLKHKESN